MPYFLVNLWLDGYESEEEMIDACHEFIVEQLDMTASSVHAYLMPEQDGEILENKLKSS